MSLNPAPFPVAPFFAAMLHNQTLALGLGLVGLLLYGGGGRNSTHTPVCRTQTRRRHKKNKIPNEFDEWERDAQVFLPQEERSYFFFLYFLVGKRRAGGLDERGRGENFISFPKY